MIDRPTLRPPLDINTRYNSIDEVDIVTNIKHKCYKTIIFWLSMKMKSDKVLGTGSYWSADSPIDCSARLINNNYISSV